MLGRIVYTLKLSMLKFHLESFPSDMTNLVMTQAIEEFIKMNASFYEKFMDESPLGSETESKRELLIDAIIEYEQKNYNLPTINEGEDDEYNEKIESLIDQKVKLLNTAFDELASYLNEEFTTNVGMTNILSRDSLVSKFKEINLLKATEVYNIDFMTEDGLLHIYI